MASPSLAPEPNTKTITTTQAIQDHLIAVVQDIKTIAKNADNPRRQSFLMSAGAGIDPSQVCGPPGDN